MIYRLNRLFNISKTRALVVAILCFIVGVPLMQGGWAMIGLGLWGYALIYGCIWFHKHLRDKYPIEQAKVSNQMPLEAEQSMSNPGSSHLFVPNPLDRQ